MMEVISFVDYEEKGKLKCAQRNRLVKDETVASNVKGKIDRQKINHN